MIRKQVVSSAVGATIFFAVLSTWSLAAMAPHQAFAQYPPPPDTGSNTVSQKTLQKCSDMGIPRAECSDSTVLLKERLSATGGGSGTSMVATGTQQMFIFVGALGAIFGGVAAAFLLQGRRASHSQGQKLSR